MDISLIFNIIFFTTTLLFGIWKVVDNKRERKREEEKRQYKEDLKTHLATGKGWVDALHEKTTSDQKYNTQQFATIKDDSSKLEKRVRVLESQQVSEEKVKNMLDAKVDPVERTLKEVRDNLILWEVNNQRLLADVSEIKGYMRAESERRNNG